MQGRDSVLLQKCQGALESVIPQGYLQCHINSVFYSLTPWIKNLDECPDTRNTAWACKTFQSEFYRIVRIKGQRIDRTGVCCDLTSGLQRSWAQDGCSERTLWDYPSWSALSLGVAAHHERKVYCCRQFQRIPITGVSPQLRNSRWYDNIAVLIFPNASIALTLAK